MKKELKADISMTLAVIVLLCGYPFDHTPLVQVFGINSILLAVNAFRLRLS